MRDNTTTTNTTLSKKKSFDNTDRLMSAYYNDLSTNILLTVAEEKELFTKYRTCAGCNYTIPPLTHTVKYNSTCPLCNHPRDIESRDKLVSGALRFVLRVAKSYATQTKGRNYPTELLQALISSGNLGLLIAVDRFNVKVGTRFLTYAAWWIREEILVELDSMGIVKVPAYKLKALRAKRKISVSGTPEDDVGYVVIEELSEVDQNKQDEQLETSTVNNHSNTLIFKAMVDLKLRNRDKYILLAYFGIHEEPKNLRQISNRLNLSSERVRQIKKELLEKLRNYLEQRGIDNINDMFTSS